jgi:hypothetical protein
MDLFTINLKFLNNQYSNEREFEEDIHLMFNNFFLLNYDTDNTNVNYIYQLGITFKFQFNVLWIKNPTESDLIQSEQEGIFLLDDIFQSESNQEDISLESIQSEQEDISLEDYLAGCEDINIFELEDTLEDYLAGQEDINIFEPEDILLEDIQFEQEDNQFKIFNLKIFNLKIFNLKISNLKIFNLKIFNLKISNLKKKIFNLSMI